MRELPMTAAPWLCATALCLVGITGGCARPRPVSAVESAPDEPSPEEASGPRARWHYQLSLDEEVETLHLGLCIEGPRPLSLVASREALAFVERAEVRGGPPLERGRERLAVATLGEQGCLDLEIDLAAAADSGGRDCERRGQTMMVPPDLWLWHPTEVPESLEATATFQLPPGVSATVPWTRLEVDEPRYRLDRSAFFWNAWTAFGRYEPIELEAAECEFEVAVLAGDRRASDEGVREWLSVAAEVVAEPFGRFPRERVAVVVIPARGWSDPVLFGMARRGGGGSAMLLLNSTAAAAELAGEWVAIHELLHLGVPLIDEPWMAEGFVTYYTQTLRARRGVLGHRVTPQEPGESFEAWQTRAALQLFADNFDRGGVRSLQSASDTMGQLGGYRRVYWGGAAVAFDLDLSIREATAGRRSLDDLIVALLPLVSRVRRWSTSELIERMDREVDRWREAGELEAEISLSAIVDGHLRSKSVPKPVRTLEGLAVEIDGGDVRLLTQPRSEALIRSGLFAPRPRQNQH